MATVWPFPPAVEYPYAVASSAGVRPPAGPGAGVALTVYDSAPGVPLDTSTRRIAKQLRLPCDGLRQNGTPFAYKVRRLKSAIDAREPRAWLTIDAPARSARTKPAVPRVVSRSTEAKEDTVAFGSTAVRHRAAPRRLLAAVRPMWTPSSSHYRQL